jgi:hypothetical protein
MFMTFGKSCKFYENSRCILEGNFCDLNCDRLFTDEDFKFYDKNDTLTQWRIEEVEREIESQRGKLR